ncbi:hypothetical protein C4Q31_05465 [Leptospira borgpetersenii serovar Ceylonica]|nr:hypothetical protein C4Q31_05465 [Leptospira borgpetersenii serovar Ceylonica]
MVILRIENFAIYRVPLRKRDIEFRERNKPKIAERNFWLFSELRISRSIERPLGSEILSSESEIALEGVEHEFLFKKVLG